MNLNTELFQVQGSSSVFEKLAWNGSSVLVQIRFRHRFRHFFSSKISDVRFRHSLWSDGLGEEEYIQKWVETLRLCVFQTSCKISPRGISALVIVLLASFVSVYPKHRKPSQSQRGSRVHRFQLGRLTWEGAGRFFFIPVCVCHCNVHT